MATDTMCDYEPLVLGGNGNSPSVSSMAGSLSTSITHIVYTRNAVRVDAIYIIGQIAMNAKVDGDLSNWANPYGVILTNEQTGDRPCLCTFDPMAFYDHAFSQNDVLQNYKVGSDSWDLIDAAV